jgi:hypothetical protein
VIGLAIQDSPGLPNRFLHVSGLEERPSQFQPGIRVIRLVPKDFLKVTGSFPRVT